MKSASPLLLAACLAASAPIFAQTAPEPAVPPPPPAPGTIVPAPAMRPIGGAAAHGPSSNRSSRVEGIDYAADGSIRSVYLRDGAFVHLSPELGRQAGQFLHKGVKLTATGDAQTFAGQTALEANSIMVAGRTFVAPNTPAGPQLAGGTPPPPMPGARAPRPEVGRGPGGSGPIRPPSPRGPRPGISAAPPPPPDAARLNGDAGAPQPGGPVPPPPPAPSTNATPQPRVAPLSPPPMNAPTPQP